MVYYVNRWDDNNKKKFLKLLSYPAFSLLEYTQSKILKNSQEPCKISFAEFFDFADLCGEPWWDSDYFFHAIQGLKSKKLISAKLIKKSAKNRTYLFAINWKEYAQIIRPDCLNFYFEYEPDKSKAKERREFLSSIGDKFSLPVFVNEQSKEDSETYFKFAFAVDNDRISAAN